jgi:hypothetical protein
MKSMILDKILTGTHQILVALQQINANCAVLHTKRVAQPCAPSRSCRNQQDCKGVGRHPVRLSVAVGHGVDEHAGAALAGAGELLALLVGGVVALDHERGVAAGGRGAEACHFLDGGRYFCIMLSVIMDYTAGGQTA